MSGALLESILREEQVRVLHVSQTHTAMNILGLVSAAQHTLIPQQGLHAPSVLAGLVTKQWWWQGWMQGSSVKDAL